VQLFIKDVYIHLRVTFYI